MFDMIRGSVATAIKKVADLVPGAADESPIEVRDGEKFYKAGYEEQKRFHKIWYRNIAYFAGHHWLDWNATNNWFQESSAPSWRVRMTTNLIMPNIRSTIAKILKNTPQFYGMPVSDDDEAKAAARIAGRLFEARYQEDDTINLFIRLFHWAKCTGSSFLWPLWDSAAGKQWTGEVDAAGNPVVSMDPAADPAPAGAPAVGSLPGATDTGATGQGTITDASVPTPSMPVDDDGDDGTAAPSTRLFAEGDVHFAGSNSFETIMQPGGPEDFAEHRKIMRVKFMDVEEIEEIWDVKVEAEAFSMETMYQARIMSIVDTMGRIMESSARAVTNNKALVKEYFELPTKKFPNGRHFIYANQKVLVPTEDLNYWYMGRRALPVAKVDDIFIPGRAQGASSIEQTGPINVMLNKMDSQVIENCNLLCRPKILTPKGSLDDDAWTDEPGEVVEYVPGPNGQKPEPAQPAEMPEYFFTMKAELPRKIEDLTSWHEVSQGRLPRRANSGVAIQALQDADDTQVGLTVKSWSSALTRAFSIALDLMQRNYTEQRLVRRIGKNRAVDVMMFKGADLKGCDVVRVVFGPYLGRQEKIDLAMQLLEQGAITTDQALEILELGDLNIIFDKDASQSQYAMFENFRMMKGVADAVGPLENHKIHIQTHMNFLNGPVGQKLPPPLKQIFEKHIFEHEQDLQPAVPGAAPQAGAPGAPPTPAAPPPPGGPQ